MAERSDPEPYLDSEYMDAMQFLNSLPDQELDQVLQEMEAAPQTEEKICPYFLMGNCRYGDQCWFTHPLGGRPETGESDQDCPICLNKVKASGKQFGLLMGCEHVFCLPCLREWRGRVGVPKELAKSCPLCRLFSPFVLPSTLPIRSYSEKKTLAESYQRNLASIPCRYFNYGESECPFGSSCFYDHTYKNGKKWIPPPPNFVCDEDGVWVVARKLKLSDFINI